MHNTKMLTRLEMMIDVVFALTIWKIFMILPRPSVEEIEILSIAKLIMAEYIRFIIAFVSVLMVSVYWIQNNKLFKYLHHTNTTHAILSILNLFLLLLFLYSIGLSIRFDGDKDALITQSVVALLFSLSTYGIWLYAMKAKLVNKSLSTQEAKVISQENFSEPVTALFR
jgi:uncharacterized membrane protein